jgi:hypothetical protein
MFHLAGNLEKAQDNYKLIDHEKNVAGALIYDSFAKRIT